MASCPQPQLTPVHQQRLVQAEVLHGAGESVTALRCHHQCHLRLVGPVTVGDSGDGGVVTRTHDVTVVQPDDGHLGGVEAPDVAGEDGGPSGTRLGGDNADLGGDWSGERGQSQLGLVLV